MSAPLVAKVWWQASHHDFHELLVHADRVVTLGRAGDADIRIGHAADYDPTVPRTWGDLAWYRDRLLVTNLDDRWSLDLVPVDDTARPRMGVPPGSSASVPVPRFDVYAQAPGSLHVLHVRTVERGPAAEAGGDDQPSFVPFTLTQVQRAIGAVLVESSRAGRARRPGYDEIARRIMYSRRHVRDHVAEMDSLLVLHGLAPTDDGSDALDRLHSALTRHPGLLL